MKILIPTDFSKPSIVAANYAIKLAEITGAQLLLFHVVSLNTYARAMVEMKAEMIAKVMMENAELDLQKFITEIKSMHDEGLVISHHIAEGERVEEVVTNFANEHGVDLIILGTKGASGIKKVLMGSNAAAVIGKSKIPVITVPEHARFRKIKNLVYSSDLQDVRHEIDIIISFASKLNATIHVVHVVNESALSDEDIKKKEQELKAACNYPSVIFKLFRNTTIIDALENYIDDINADMIAMFTHKLTFFESLFGKSVTREMAFQSRVPLLAIKK